MANFGKQRINNQVLPNPDNIKGQGFHTDPSRINKAGRPKGSRTLSSILKEMLEEKVEITNEDGTKEKKKLSDVIVRKLITKAVKKEDIKAIQEIFDRTEGKPHSEFHHSGIVQHNHKDITKLKSIEDMPDEVKQAIFEMGMQQLTDEENRKN